MIDTRAVAQEVQDQLAAAVHKSHEQFRKGQEQIRKGRESVTAAVRTGGHIAQAVRPNLPKVQLRFPSLSELASPEKLLATQRKLASHAQEFADQAVATQRKLGSRAVEVASPLIADGMAKLTQVAGTFAAGRRTERTGPLERAEVAPEPAATAAPAAKVAEAAAAKAPATEAPAAEAPAADTKPAAKPRAARAAGTARSAGTAKSAGQAKAKSTAASKPRTAQK